MNDAYCAITLFPNAITRGHVRGKMMIGKLSLQGKTRCHIPTYALQRTFASAEQAEVCKLNLRPFEEILVEVYVLLLRRCSIAGERHGLPTRQLPSICYWCTRISLGLTFHARHFRENEARENLTKSTTCWQI